jgi:hypothetical protein
VEACEERTKARAGAREGDDDHEHGDHGQDHDHDHDEHGLRGRGDVNLAVPQLFHAPHATDLADDHLGPQGALLQEL